MYAETDRAELWAFMRQHSFAIVCSQVNQRPFATHIPLLLDPDRGDNGYLIGHLAKANPHWRHMDGEVLTIFSGPHAYISPTWYEAKHTVPTWNYLAVHVYGRFLPVDDRARLRWIVEETVRVYETAMPTPWRIDMPPEQLDKMLNGIMGFEIAITEIQGKKKLNQNHSLERRERVIRALNQQEDDNSQAVAAAMTKSLPA